MVSLRYLNYKKILKILLFVVLGWLLFFDLSDNYLWNDEASTAILARNVLKFGYPRSFDGLNYHYPSLPHLNRPGTYIWIGDPWLQYYIMALSFKIFGINTWSSRVLFVISGFLTLVLVYLFSLRYLKSHGIGILSVILLGTSVPFLLHARQARYYGLVILLSITAFYLYYKIIKDRKGYFWLGSTLVFLTLVNYAAFIPVSCGLWILALIVDRTEIKWHKFIFMSIFPIMFFIGWVLFSWVLIKIDTVCFPVNFSLNGIRRNLEFQIRTINTYFMPIFFWFSAVIFFWISKRRDVFKIGPEDRKFFIRMGTILLANITFFSLAGMRTMRYYVQYLPFLCLGEAFLLYRLFEWKKIFAIVILPTLIFTNFLSRPDKPRFYFLNYLYEITHEYTGPMEALSKYLKLHAKPKDRVKILKGDLEIIFYNPELLVLNDARYFQRTYPEWIVVRKYWNPIYEDKWRNELHAEIEPGYLDVLERYDKVLLPAVDSIWENSPDSFEEHFFRQPVITPENQMVVYHLRQKG